MADPARPLTAKQARFVEEFLVDANATQAAIRAGYSARTARQTAAENLSKPDIQAALQEGIAARSQRTLTHADQVVRELGMLAFSDVGDVLDFTGRDVRLRPANEIPEHARRAISSIKVRRYTEGQGDAAREVEVTEFKLWPKVRALEQLGRHLGLFKEALPPPGPTINGNVNVFPTPDAVSAFLATLAAGAQRDPLRADHEREQGVPPALPAPAPAGVPPGG